MTSLLLMLFDILLFASTGVTRAVDSCSSLKSPLLKEDLPAREPFLLFRTWSAFAHTCNITNIFMDLATASKEGVPSIRTVVLVGEPTDGFVFFSHYDSLKGRQLAENPVASGSFYWPHTRPTDRQIIFTGNVTRLSPEESDIYWNSVSTTYKLLNYFKQGQIVRGNEVMESMRAASESDHPDGMMPRPATWGGFIIRPYVIEFSQGRTGRRDRFVFKKLRPDEIFDVVSMERGTDGWVIYRILP